MTDLRKAAEMALEALEMFCEHGAILRPLETKETLRQALAEPELQQRTGDCLLTGSCAAEGHKIYTAASKREWVGLSDEEIDAAVKSCNTLDTYKYFRAIEAKLKEKNT